MNVDVVPFRVVSLSKIVGARLAGLVAVTQS